MNCEYILMWTTDFCGEVGSHHKFHAATPEGATELARARIKQLQAEYAKRFPHEFIVVTGELYRQIREIDGSEFIETKEADAGGQVNPSLIDRHMTP